MAASVAVGEAGNPAAMIATGVAFRCSIEVLQPDEETLAVPQLGLLELIDEHDQARRIVVAGKPGRIL